MFQSPHEAPAVTAPHCYYARPLVHGLERRLDLDLALHDDAAAEHTLATGACACGLVSPTALLANPHLSVLPGAGAVARESIPTERLVTRTPLEHIRHIEVAPGAGRLETYVRVAFAERGLTPPVFTPAGKDGAGLCDAVLVSGDAGLAHIQSPGHDLGVLWRETTGLPMVLAVWACGPGAPYRRLRHILAEAARHGEEALALEAAGTARSDGSSRMVQEYLYFRVLSLESDSIRALHELARRYAICETTGESIAFC